MRSTINKENPLSWHISNFASGRLRGAIMHMDGVMRIYGSFYHFRRIPIDIYTQITNNKKSFLITICHQTPVRSKINMDNLITWDISNFAGN